MEDKKSSNKIADYCYSNLKNYISHFIKLKEILLLPKEKFYTDLDNIAHTEKNKLNNKFLNLITNKIYKYKFNKLMRYWSNDVTHAYLNLFNFNDNNDIYNFYHKVKINHLAHALDILKNGNKEVREEFAKSVIDTLGDNALPNLKALKNKLIEAAEVYKQETIPENTKEPFFEIFEKTAAHYKKINYNTNNLAEYISKNKLTKNFIEKSINPLIEAAEYLDGTDVDSRALDIEIIKKITNELPVDEQLPENLKTIRKINTLPDLKALLLNSLELEEKQDKKQDNAPKIELGEEERLTKLTKTRAEKAIAKKGAAEKYTGSLGERWQVFKARLHKGIKNKSKFGDKDFKESGRFVNLDTKEYGIIKDNLLYGDNSQALAEYEKLPQNIKDKYQELSDKKIKKIKQGDANYKLSYKQKDKSAAYHFFKHDHIKHEIVKNLKYTDTDSPKGFTITNENDRVVARSTTPNIVEFPPRDNGQISQHAAQQVVERMSESIKTLSNPYMKISNCANNIKAGIELAKQTLASIHDENGNDRFTLKLNEDDGTLKAMKKAIEDSKKSDNKSFTQIEKDVLLKLESQLEKQKNKHKAKPSNK